VLRKHGAHGLDTPAQPRPTVGADHLLVLVFGDEPDHRLPGRSSSAPKKIAAAFKLSLVIRGSQLAVDEVNDTRFAVRRNASWSGSSVSMTGLGMRVQRVEMPFGDRRSWTLTDDGSVVETAESFLAHLHAVERSPNTVKAYAHDLRDWFEFLGQHGLVWSAVRLEDVGRFVGWLRLPAGIHQPLRPMPPMGAKVIVAAPQIHLDAREM
jgi:hypothetical protein